MRNLLSAVVLLVCLGAAHVAWAGKGSGCILHEDSYGARLPGSDSRVALWWASSGWKVSRDRAVPRRKGRAIEISAARNETEAAQLVITPSSGLRGLVARAGALESDGGGVIPAESIEILEVGYVDVVMRTDLAGAEGAWPDPLPPMSGPIDVEAGENQPLWIRVHVPSGTPAGEYEGSIEIDADGYGATVPLRVRVYGFELPDRMTCKTAFGFSVGLAFAYQNVVDEGDKRLVWEKYLENLSAHHVSPYDPAQLTRLSVEWVRLGEEEGAGLDPADRALLQEHALTPRFAWEEWDAAMERAFEHYHFNTFRVGIPGIGGGELGGFAEGTRERELAFGVYCQAVEEHLREKGWLDESYVYWFDEPEPKDYGYVSEGFRRLKDAAPGINRMLTEQPESELYGGPNIWCPQTFFCRSEEIEERKAEGETFWWYVCTLPKAPLVGLFIDHPGTDMRVWLWQTWQLGIEGVLVWQTNYWTSGSAYPGGQQNPYEDTMSWMTGYFSKPGDRIPWGNGDGRFIYPPMAAAGVAKEPVLDGPVDSIRWEMLRDGIEDYEYLAMLKSELEKPRKPPVSKRKRRGYERLLDVPDEISGDLKTYTKDPAVIERRRERVARAVEDLLNPRMTLLGK